MEGEVIQCDVSDNEREPGSETPETRDDNENGNHDDYDEMPHLQAENEVIEGLGVAGHHTGQCWVGVNGDIYGWEESGDTPPPILSQQEEERHPGNESVVQQYDVGSSKPASDSSTGAPWSNAISDFSVEEKTRDRESGNKKSVRCPFPDCNILFTPSPDVVQYNVRRHCMRKHLKIWGKYNVASKLEKQKIIQFVDSTVESYRLLRENKEESTIKENLVQTEEEETTSHSISKSDTESLNPTETSSICLSQTLETDHNSLNISDNKDSEKVEFIPLSLSRTPRLAGLNARFKIEEEFLKDSEDKSELLLESNASSDQPSCKWQSSESHERKENLEIDDHVPRTEHSNSNNCSSPGQDEVVVRTKVRGRTERRKSNIYSYVVKPVNKPVKRFFCPECCSGYTRRSTMHYHLKKCHPDSDHVHNLENQFGIAGKYDLSVMSNVQENEKERMGAIKSDADMFQDDISVDVREHYPQRNNDGTIQEKDLIEDALMLESNSELEESLESLQPKISTSKKYVCNKCELDFESVFALNQHRRQEHLTPLRGTHYESSHSQTIVHVPSEIVDSVQLDTSTTSTKSGVLPEKSYQCEICNSKHNSKNNLNRHKRRVHKLFSKPNPVKAKRFYCDICNSGFTLRNSMSKHMRQTHKLFSKSNPVKAKRFYCVVCNSGFTTSMTLKRHMRSQHLKSNPNKQKTTEETKRFYCDICNAGFTQDCNLNRHKKRFHMKHWTNSYESKRLSPQKPESSSTNVVLTNNSDESTSQINTEKGNKSNMANASCHLIADLKAAPGHNSLLKENNKRKRKANDDRQMKKRKELSNRNVLQKPLYECAHCPATYTQRGSFNKHMKSKHGPNQETLKCQYCDKSFPDVFSVTSHIQLEHGSKPYKCREPGCAKRFYKSFQLTNHVIESHAINSAHLCSNNESLTKFGDVGDASIPLLVNSPLEESWEDEAETHSKEKEDLQPLIATTTHLTLPATIETPRKLGTGGGDGLALVKNGPWDESWEDETETHSKEKEDLQPLIATTTHLTLPATTEIPPKLETVGGKVLAFVKNGPWEEGNQAPKQARKAKATKGLEAKAEPKNTNKLIELKHPDTNSIVQVDENLLLQFLSPFLPLSTSTEAGSIEGNYDLKEIHARMRRLYLRNGDVDLRKEEESKSDKKTKITKTSTKKAKTVACVRRDAYPKC